jgi:hypothetical protein
MDWVGLNPRPQQFQLLKKKLVQAPRLYNLLLAKGQKNDKGYFTESDLAFQLMMMSNSKWTEDSTKEFVEQLLQDGTLIGYRRGSTSLSQKS